MDRLNKNRNSRNSRSRHGTLLVEFTTAIFLLLVCVSILARMNSASRQFQRNASQRAHALLLAGNALEYVSLLGHDQLTTEDVAAALQAMPYDSTVYRCQVDVEPRDGGIRLTALVSWDSPSGKQRQVSLARWHYPLPSKNQAATPPDALDASGDDSP